MYKMTGLLPDKKKSIFEAELGIFGKQGGDQANESLRHFREAK